MRSNPVKDGARARRTMDSVSRTGFGSQATGRLPVRWTLPLVSCLALWSGPAAAQTKEEEALFGDDSGEEQFFKLEEEAVTIASKHAQSTSEAPASITVLSSDDIQRYAFRDMTDLLRTVAGWFVSNGHDYVYGGVRGMMLKGDQNTRILVLVDGHTLNENWSSAAALDDTLGMDLAAVSRVEVLQGPSSTLYGTNAFFGVINIVTKSGDEVSKGAVTTDLGSFGYTRLTASSGMTKGDLKYHARLGVVAAEGRYLYFPDRAEAASAGYTSPSADALRGVNAFAKVQAKDLQVLARFSNRFKHIPTAPYDSVLNSDLTRYDQTRYFVEGRYSRAINDKTSVMARLYYDGYRFGDHLELNGEEQVDGEGNITYGNPVIFRDLGSADWVGGEFQTGLTLVDTEKLSNQTYVGLEANRNSTRSQSYVAVSDTNDSPDDSFEPVDIPATILNAAAYVQNELSYADSVHFVAGLRFDYNSAFLANTSVGQLISPRAALIFRTKTDSTFKLLYARGFRNPSSYEAYFRDNVDIEANPGLRPESIQNVELIYDYRLKKILKFSLASYYFQATDLLRQETVVCQEDGVEVEGAVDCAGGTGERQQFQNVAALEGLGTELSLQAVLPSGLQGRATLALQRSADLSDRQQLLNSPAVVGNLLVAYPVLKDKATFSGQLHAVSERQAGLSEDGVAEVAPAYVLGNLTMSTRELVKGLDVQFGVYNLFNWRYSDVAVAEEIVVDHSDEPVTQVPADGRTFAVRATYRF